MRHLIWIIFDSARYDTFLAAHTPNIDLIGKCERRWSYASWTAPSHYAFLMGVMPHPNHPWEVASTQYRRDLSRWQERIGAPEGALVDFSSFAPRLSLPAFLKSIGYRCEAYVSLPVLNPGTVIAQHFDHFELLPEHNNLGNAIERLKFDADPMFYFINTGETHFPYSIAGEPAADLPVLHGLHGVWRNLNEFLRDPGACADDDDKAWLFNLEALKPLWHKQVKCIEHLDKVVGQLMDCAPPDTWIIVTSDHGELFGEEGFFGHGPIFHEKVFEVFFVEGLNPQQKKEPMGTTEKELTDRVIERLHKLGYI